MDATGSTHLFEALYRVGKVRNCYPSDGVSVRSENVEMLTRLKQSETGVRKIDADDVEAPCLQHDVDV